MKALLIGCGQMGFIHLQKLLENQDIGEVSVVEPDLSRQQEVKSLVSSMAITYYQKLEEALSEYSANQSAPDICVVASNTAFHGGNLLRLIEKFNDRVNPPLLFIEKPLVSSVDELEVIESKLRAYPGHVVGGYLIRYSPVCKMALEYLTTHQLTICSIDSSWSKKRQPSRPSAGVLVDEATHSIDLILNYLIPASGFSFSFEQIDLLSLKGIHSNTVVNIEKQKALYGPSVTPALADIEYQMLVSGSYPDSPNKQITINGHSSFMSPHYERTIKLTCTDDILIQCEFDIEQHDHLRVFKNGKELVHHSVKCDKVSIELTSAIQLRLGNDLKSPAANLSDMVLDIHLINKLQQKINDISKQTKEGESFSWTSDKTSYDPQSNSKCF